MNVTIITLSDSVAMMEESIALAASLDAEQRHAEAVSVLRNSIENSNIPWESDMDSELLERYRCLVQEASQEAERQARRQASLTAYLEF